VKTLFLSITACFFLASTLYLVVYPDSAKAVRACLSNTTSIFRTVSTDGSPSGSSILDAGALKAEILRRMPQRMALGLHLRSLQEEVFGVARKARPHRMAAFGNNRHGGEPLDQDPEEVLFDIGIVRKVFGDVPVFVYTGYEWTNL